MNSIETERLILREIERGDYTALCRFLQDADVMYAWEHAFTDSEVNEWIEKNIDRYEKDGYSYWAVIEKTEGRLIGVSGILSELAGEIPCTGIGYIFEKEFWRQGYALESASACVDYAFYVLGLNEITAQIRPQNTASRRVAEKLGMTVKSQFVKHYRGKDMVHLLYSLSKNASHRREATAIANKGSTANCMCRAEDERP